MHLLALFALIFTFSAHACPDLSGTYAQCISESGRIYPSYKLKVTQSEDALGVTTYEFRSTVDWDSALQILTYRTDGQAHGSSENFITSNCLNDSVQVIEEFTIAGELSDKAFMVMKKEGSRLIQSIEANVIGEDFKDTIICQ